MKMKEMIMLKTDAYDEALARIEGFLNGAKVDEITMARFQFIKFELLKKTPPSP
jgi:hypothetical protein